MCSCFPTSLWPQRGGRCGRGPTRPGRAEVQTPLPQHSRPPLCLVPWLPVGQSGAPAVPVSTWARGGAGRRGAHPGTSLSSRSALRAPPEGGPGRTPAAAGGARCVPGSPGPAVRGLGRQLRPVPPALPGAVAGWGLSPFLSHVRGCCWGSGSLPGPPSANSARGAGGCPPPPSGVSFPASPPLGRSRGCAQLRPPRGTGLSSPRRCPAGPTLLCRATMPGRLCPATCWAPGARGAGTMATFRELTWAS